MIEGEYIKNNTRFSKPQKSNIYDLFLRNVVFLTSENLKQNLESLIKEENINTIRITTHDYKFDNLDFLKDYDLKNIKSIDILSDTVKNIEGIYNLPNLELVSSINKKIDYSRFDNLRGISGELSSFSYKSLKQIESLEFISLSKFREKDISIFSKNKKLEYLMLRASKIESLIGIENCQSLKFLGLFHNRNINSLEGLTPFHQVNLKELNVYKAPKLFFVNDFLKELTNLTNLQLECKKVDSFEFLNSLKKLELLGIHNKVVDVDDNNKLPLIEALKRTGSKIW